MTGLQWPRQSFPVVQGCAVCLELVRWLALKAFSLCSAHWLPRLLLPLPGGLVELLGERLRSISAKPQLCCHFETSSTERPVVGVYSETKSPFHGDKLKMTAKASGQRTVQGQDCWSLSGLWAMCIHIWTHLVQRAAPVQSLTLRMSLAHLNVGTTCLGRSTWVGNGGVKTTSSFSKGTWESWLHILPSHFSFIWKKKPWKAIKRHWRRHKEPPRH